MIVDVYFLHCIDETEGGEWGRWACDALMTDGSTVSGTIMGDGDGAWDDETFEPYADFANDGLDDQNW